MGRIIINPGGAGGIDPDELTVTPEKVLAGEIFGGAGSDEPQTGTMDVQSILSFSAAPYSSKEVMFTWQNPAKGAFSGVIIVGKEGGYPEDINDGTRYYKGYGDNPAANGMSSMAVDGFFGGVTYYFRAFSYALRNDAEWISGTTYTAMATTTKGQQTFTSSGTFTVPDGVRFIDVFLVGGGSGGSGVYGGRCGGGGSGYTKTVKDISTSPGQQFAVTIGAGGSGGIGGGGVTTAALPGNGGSTSFGEYSIGGGTRAPKANNGAGNGGSGGGWDAAGYSDGAGGSSGTDGKGQGTTTRAFGESTNTLYAGGGGGAICSGSSTHNAHAGGAGGGGSGGYRYKSGMVYASAGGANTGGGGGGCAWVSFSLGAGAGGSGIVIVRWGY